jgi:hypothetical protein
VSGGAVYSAIQAIPSGGMNVIKADSRWFDCTGCGQVDNMSSTAYIIHNKFVHLDMEIRPNQNIPLTNAVHIASIHTGHLPAPPNVANKYVPFVWIAKGPASPTWLTCGFLYGFIDYSGRIFIGHMPDFTLPQVIYSLCATVSYFVST